MSRCFGGYGKVRTDSCDVGSHGFVKVGDGAVEGGDDASALEFCAACRCGEDLSAEGEESEEADGELHFEICVIFIFRRMDYRD